MGQVQFGFIGDAYVGLSIEKEDGKHVATLSVNRLSKKKEREAVRLFFGDKETSKTEGFYCTMYSAEYGAPEKA